MAIRSDEPETITSPAPPPVLTKKTITTIIPKKAKAVPIQDIRKVFAPPPPGEIKINIAPPPLPLIKIVTTTSPAPPNGGPGNPATTGLGSQVKPSEDSLFGSFGSEGVSGEAAGIGAIGGVDLSKIPTFVWIGLALLLGYFLID